MKIIHVYNQDLKHDIRTRRYGKTINAHFPSYDFLLAGQKKDISIPAVETLGSKFKVLRKGGLRRSSFSANKAIDFIAWNFRILVFLLKQKNVKVISGHSLKVLPVCTIASIIKGTKLVYDTHEIETHTTSKGVLVKALTLIEAVCMPRVHNLVVTSPGHERWYLQKYKKPVYLIRNCPGVAEKPVNNAAQYDLKLKLGISPSDQLFIYVGIINTSRGVDTILQAFKQVKQTKHILFLGFGQTDFVEKASHEFVNIHYLPPVPPLELINYIASADVGIHMMHSSNLNHIKALPNKPMQYMAAGLPSIVSNVEVMAELVSSADAGWVVNEGDSESLVSLINTIDSSELEQFAANAKRWFINNNWENESLKLVALYNSLFERS